MQGRRIGARHDGLETKVGGQQIRERHTSWFGRGNIAFIDPGARRRSIATENRRGDSNLGPWGHHASEGRRCAPGYQRTASVGRYGCRSGRKTSLHIRNVLTHDQRHVRSVRRNNLRQLACVPHEAISVLHALPDCLARPTVGWTGVTQAQTSVPRFAP